MIKEWVLEWFKKNGKVTEEKMDIDINYIDAGYIDSFGFLDFISECEEKFSFNFNDDDFSNEKLFTINGIIEIIKEKRNS